MSVERAPDTSLDELFGEAEPAAPGSVAPARRWLLKAVLQTFVVTAVVYTLPRALGLAPSFALVLAVSAGAVLIRLAAVSVAEPAGRRPRDLLRPMAARPEPAARADGMLGAIRQWDHRLAHNDRELAQRLGELADERLRQRHGLTRASDPARARALLGEPLWTVLTAPAVTAAQAETVVRRLETME